MTSIQAASALIGDVWAVCAAACFVGLLATERSVKSAAKLTAITFGIAGVVGALVFIAVLPVVL